MKCSSAIFLSLSAACLAAAPRAGAQTILLWQHGAPGSEGKAGDEIIRVTDAGDHVSSRIHKPSGTVYLPPRATATGAAIVVLPGGGQRELWMDHEGYRVGQWLAEHGIAAFVVKYRLSREEGSTYTENDAVGDAQRALRVVRSRASEWNVDPNRVGMAGFSAGGTLAILAATRFDAGNASATDPIDRQSSRPAFVALIYPGIPTGLTVPKDVPPIFLLAGANDSKTVTERLPALYASLSQAGGSAELHMIAGAPHGFGIRDTNPRAIAAWPNVMYDWIEGRGFLRKR